MTKRPLPEEAVFDVTATHQATGAVKLIATDRSQEHAEILMQRVIATAVTDGAVYQIVPAGSVEPKGRFPRLKRVATS